MYYWPDLYFIIEQFESCCSSSNNAVYPVSGCITAIIDATARAEHLESALAILQIECTTETLVVFAFQQLHFVAPIIVWQVVVSEECSQLQSLRVAKGSMEQANPSNRPCNVVLSSKTWLGIFTEYESFKQGTNPAD